MFFNRHINAYFKLSRATLFFAVDFKSTAFPRSVISTPATLPTVKDTGLFTASISVVPAFIKREINMLLSAPLISIHESSRNFMTSKFLFATFALSCAAGVAVCASGFCGTTALGVGDAGETIGAVFAVGAAVPAAVAGDVAGNVAFGVTGTGAVAAIGAGVAVAGAGAVAAFGAAAACDALTAGEAVIGTVAGTGADAVTDAEGELAAAAVAGAAISSFVTRFDADISAGPLAEALAALSGTVLKWSETVPPAGADVPFSAFSETVSAAPGTNPNQCAANMPTTISTSKVAAITHLENKPLRTVGGRRDSENEPDKARFSWIDSIGATSACMRLTNGSGSTFNSLA